MDKSSNQKKNTGRKNNPDYEAKKVKTRDGVIQTVYYKKTNNKEPPKKNVGTPEKRRGGFKAKGSKGNTGLLPANPTIASSMAKPIGNYSLERIQKNAVYNLETMNKLSDKTREKLQGQYVAPKQQKMMKGRSRTNPSA